MSDKTPTSIRKNIWVNIIFFALTTLVGVVGAPIYIAKNGLPLPLVILTIVFIAISGMGITVGYHRYFAHRTFQTNNLVKYFLLFCGSTAFEQSAIHWAAQHVDHHAFVDTDKDPYSIKKGFWYAHIGWLVFWEHKVNYDRVPHMTSDPIVVNQDKYFALWAITAGVITPTLIGALFGCAGGAFIIAFCLRLTIVYHSTFLINSACHMFGKASYDIHASAKDNWLIAFLTFGEGYHNFHHRFALDYRNGIRWYDWDPSKWSIFFLSKLGLAWNLKRTSTFRILEAQMAGENKRIDHWLTHVKMNKELIKLGESFRAQHEKVKQSLKRWEQAATEYKKVMQDQVTHYSEDVRKNLNKKLDDAKKQFQNTHEHWEQLLNQYSEELQKLVPVSASLAA